MLQNLKSLFPNAVLFSGSLDRSLEHHYVFYDRAGEEWIGIPKEDVTEKEINILKTMYELVESQQLITEANSIAGSWYRYLFSNGPLPSSMNGSYIRFNQFQIKGNSFEKSEFELALKGFIPHKILLLWVTSYSGVVIETSKQKHLSLSDKDLASMTETLESDFFIHPLFYYGKQYPFTQELRERFHEEKGYFTFAQTMHNRMRFFTFERVFPSYMVFHLPNPVKEIITKSFVSVFQEDPETFSTIKAFLENNLNASVTAKKLFIHRNTLQYRIDKFTEKTGIQFKDFYGAFMGFLACLVFEEKMEKEQ
jgi:hypothetical protein